MPDGIELAKAYVQIVPSAEGIQGKITEALGGEPAAAGDAAGQSLGAQLVGTLKKVIAAAGIGKIISESINLGGALQQSLGGVETLFKDSADTVKAYAAQAYKTVGLSANDYMEQTTSFAASLLSSVSQDTQAAADLANMAMVDMADNSNKMGTSMQDIQNAYQGFAKQNYTMLDNLKLGYGGTQAEMQRLLKDAEKISGVHYDLGNLADMYSAIHVIQKEMDITGTTAKEASTTLTGSFAAMKAAAENVLADWSTGADLTEPLQALADTAQTFLVDNLLPMIGNVLAGIPEIVYSLVPELLQTGTELLSSLAQGFTEGIPEFFSTALPQLLAFTDQLRDNAASFVDAGLNLITQLLNGLIAGLPDLIAYVPDIIINICGIINDNMPKILGEGVAIIVQLVAGLVQTVPSLLANWKKILEAVLSVISAINWLNIGKTILTGVANGVKSMGSSLLNAFKGGFSSALAWIKSLPSQAVQWGKNLIQSFINGLTGKGGAVGAGAIAATAGATIAKTASGNDWSSVWADANADVADSAQSMAEVVVPAYTKSGDAATKAAKKTKAAAQAAETLLWSLQDAGHTDTTNALGKVTIQTTELTEHLRKGSEEYDRLTRTVTESGKEMVNGVATTFKQVETKVNGTVTKVTKTYDDMSKTLLGTFTNVSETTFNGITTKVQQAVEKYADGSEHIKKNVTETGQRIGENGAETYEKIITYIDGIQDKVTETSNLIDKSVKGTQNRIDQQLSEASGQLDKGIFGLVKNTFKDAKNGDWASLGLDFVNLIWGEVSQGQRDVISKWLTDALTAVNEGYFSGGIGKAFDIFQKLFSDGGVKSDIDGVTNSVKAFGEIIDGLAKSGGVGGALGSIVQSFSGMAGSITSALGTIVSFVAANPILALILGVGAVAGGIGLAMWMDKKNNQQPVSHYQSPFDKTGVYDSLGTFSTRAALQYRVTGQQSIVDRQTSILERIEGMLDEHLPDIGKGQVVMDSGELVGVLSPRMATNVDARIGVTVTRKARGV